MSFLTRHALVPIIALVVVVALMLPVSTIQPGLRVASRVGIPMHDDTQHLLLGMAVSSLLAARIAAANRFRHQLTVTAPISVMLSVAFGAMLELFQPIAGRRAELTDFTSHVTGTVLGVVWTVALIWVAVGAARRERSHPAPAGIRTDVDHQIESSSR